MTTDVTGVLGVAMVVPCLSALCLHYDSNRLQIVGLQYFMLISIETCHYLFFPTAEDLYGKISSST